MKSIIGYTLALFLLLGSGLAHAQTAVWTGDYYVVVGMNEKQQYAVTYGNDLKWHEIKAGPDFGGGTLADLTASPMLASPSERLPGRYELLAVGALDGKAYAVTGYEYATEPRFVEGMDPIPGMIAPTAAVWTGAYYVVLGRGLGGDGVLPTLRDVVAFGRPGDWQVTYLPFNDALTFTHLAVGTWTDPARHRRYSTTGVTAPYELLAVGRDLDGAAFSMVGHEVGGVPTFSGYPLPIPEIMRPLSVEWTGHEYVVVGGDRGDGQYGMMYGAPGRWSRAKDFSLDGGVFTALAAAPTPETRPTAPLAYELLAVGTLKTMAVALPGQEVDGMPEFEGGCSLIPELRGTTLDGPSTGPAFAVGAGEAGALGVPYPNPFDARATLTVTVGEDQRVRVAVYDALGREVAVLHDGVLAAGTHTATFDGSGLPGGTYFVRAAGERFAQTRPVVLAR